MSTPKQIATLLRSIADVLDGAIVDRVEKDLILEVGAAEEVLEMEEAGVPPDLGSADDAPCVTDLRSDCCNSQIVASAGEEGTSFYRCLSCGDACAWHHRDSPLPVPAKQVRAKRKVTFECCGSRNWKHKGGCDGARALAPEGEWVEATKEAPKPDAGKYECDECSKEFEAVDAGDVVKCPACQSANVWPVKVV